MKFITGTPGLRLLCVILALGGLVLVIGGVPGTGTTGWPPDVVAPGVGLLAAAIAGLVALRGVQSWQEKQSEHAATATRENRARVYEKVLGHVISSFAGGAPPTQEAHVRAMAAAWGSDRTLKALGDWFRYGAANSGVDNPDKPHSFELIYRIVVAMRGDVDSSTAIKKDDVLRMIFNDYDPEKHNPEGVVSISIATDGTVTSA